MSLTHAWTRTLLTRAISKPWVVEADPKLLEMQIPPARAVQKQSQGKASAPVQGQVMAWEEWTG